MSSIKIRQKIVIFTLNYAFLTNLFCKLRTACSISRLKYSSGIDGTKLAFLLTLLFSAWGRTYAVKEPHPLTAVVYRDNIVLFCPTFCVSIMYRGFTQLGAVEIKN